MSVSEGKSEVQKLVYCEACGKDAKIPAAKSKGYVHTIEQSINDEFAVPLDEVVDVAENTARGCQLDYSHNRTGLLGEQTTWLKN
jgi:hypothetical protein